MGTMKSNLNPSFFIGLTIGVLSPLVLLPLIVFVLAQSYG
jgi:tetrahydromethanopterin S-methyltransferase subunit F